MTSELPKIGQVLNYIYLFSHEAKVRDEGLKQRPVVVINVNASTRRIAVVAVTSKGERYPGTVPIPPDVARAANLADPSSILVTEYNLFTWLGFDLRPLTPSQGFVIGRLPPGFTAKIRQMTATGASINRD
jgi:PemK-like, MazF-like toxin of type II toxin-antitoxin system